MTVSVPTPVSDYAAALLIRPTRLFEVYADEAAFDAHRIGPWVAQFREEAAAIERKLTFTTGELLDD